MANTGLLLSGGIDSMVCLSLLQAAKHEVTAYHVDFGQAAARPERMAAEQLAKFFNVPFRVLRMDLGCEFQAGEVPFRNAAMIFAVAMAAGDSIDQLAVGVHTGVPYPDCSANFLDAIKKAMFASTTRPVALVAPLKTWHKKEILAYASAKELPLFLTYSCETGTVPACGECLSCKDRAELAC